MPLGTLCVVDQVPGYLSPAQTRALGALAREVVVHLELRRAVAALSKPLAELSRDPILDPDVRDELRQASEEASSASALVGQAMERVLEAELRLQNLVNRLRTVQGRPQPLPGG
jgi:ubiquinone biosynthesis protein Coq4